MMSRDKIEDKLEELIAASRLNELLNKKEAEEEKKKSITFGMLEYLSIGVPFCLFI